MNKNEQLQKEKEERLNGFKLHLIREFEKLFEEFFNQSKADITRLGFDGKDHYKTISACLMFCCAKFIAKTHLEFKISTSVLVDTLYARMIENIPNYIDQLKNEKPKSTLIGL